MTVTSGMLTVRDALNSISLINKERSVYGLPRVTYNYTVQKELELIPQTYWFNTSLNRTQEFYLGKEKRVRPYNLYFHTASEPFKYLFHDTVRDSMASIVRFRIKQRPCFKLGKCSLESFNMFYSCGGKPQDVQNSQRCSWFFHYYPRVILRSLEQISCILPDIQGPNVPSNLQTVQKKVFICFGEFGNITTDNPLKN